MAKRSSLHILNEILGANRWFYLLSSVLFVAVILFRTLEPKVFQWLTDALLQNAGGNGGSTAPQVFGIALLARHLDPMVSIILYYSLLYIFITFCRSSVVFIAHVINARSTEDALQRLRDRLFNHLQRIPINHFVSQSKGEIIQRSTNDLEVVKAFVQGNIVEVIRILFLLVFSTIIMLRINVVITLVSLCLMPLVVVLSVMFYRRERVVWEQHEEESDKLNTLIQENIQGIRTIKAYAGESKAQAEFGALNRRRYEAGIRQFRLHGVFWPAMNFVVFLQIVVSNLYAIYLASEGVLSVGELLGVGIMVNMMLWPVRQVSSILSNFTMAMVALQRIDELLAIPEEEEYVGTTKLQSLFGEIEFDHVWFRYPGQKGFALKDLSFRVSAGDRVAIIGPTGSGKSTILKLLLRFYEPALGEIRLDGRNLNTFPKAYLRTRIGAALQNSMLFSTTIKENMLAVCPTATSEHILSCMERAAIENIVSAGEASFSRMIGEKGINLSGGQKQRMALARLLLKNPEVYILDDVTSYVDELNEKRILEELRRATNGHTCIIMSHKLSAISFANKVIALERGEIAQMGTQLELQRCEGYFGVIYNLQTDGKLLTPNLA